MSSRRQRRRQKKASKQHKAEAEQQQPQSPQQPDWANDKSFADIDWDAEIFGDSNTGMYDGSYGHESDPVGTIGYGYEAPKIKLGFRAPDPTDASWDLRREELDRKEANIDASQQLAIATDKFRDKLAQFSENAEPEVMQAVLGLLGAHADLTVARVMKDMARREDDRVTVGSGVEPHETRRDFLNLGARLYRAVELDPDQPQSNLDLIAATLDAVGYLHPASWKTVEKAMLDPMTEADATKMAKKGKAKRK